MYSKLVMLSLSAWFFLSSFVDFIVIPGAFRVVGDILKAGTLGISVFSTLNKIEVLLGAVLVFSLFKGTKFSYKKVQMFLSKVLFSIAVFYYYYLSPKIELLTEKLFATGLDEAAKALVNKDHQFYHSLYVKLDAVKIILLLVLLVLQFVNNKKKNQDIQKGEVA